MESVTKVQRDQHGKWTKARSTPQGQKRADVLILISLRASRWTSFIYFPVRLERQAILRCKNQSTAALWTSSAWSCWKAGLSMPWRWSRLSAAKGTKIAAAVYLYQADNDGEWGEMRFDFATGTAEIVKLADWDTTKSNIFAKTAIRHIQSLPEAKPPSEVVVMFDQAMWS